MEKYTKYRGASIALRTLAKQNVLDIFNFIKENPKCAVETVTEYLQKTVDQKWTQAETSTMLKMLRDSNLVSTERDGKYIRYEENLKVTEKVLPLANSLAQIYS